MSLKTPMSAGGPGVESIFFMTRKRRLRNPVAHASADVMMSGGKNKYRDAKVME